MKHLFSVKGKTAIVTGGSEGIGRMIVEGLVAAGVRTYVVARSADKCQQVADEYSADGTCVALPGDLSTLAGIEQVIADFSAREKQLDILINNAGVHQFIPLDELGEERWDLSMNINVKSVFFLTQKLLPLLRASGTSEDPARVINLGSTDGERVSDMEHYDYYASKAAVHQISRALGRRLAPEHINVNAIAPGPFPTKVTQEAASEEVIEAIKGTIPRRRFGSPDDIVGSVIYLCSRAGAYTNATILAVDGGIAGA